MLKHKNSFFLLIFKTQYLDSKKGRLMFGQYDIPIRIEQEGITVSVQKEGENILYMRECLGGER